jgi:hypothetical protein
MSNHCEKWKSDFRDDAFRDKHKSPLLSERFKSHLQLPSIRHSPNQQRITNPTTNPNPTKTKGKEKMGGSYLLCIYHASRFVIAQYGSHHSYPSGAGLSIMEWISPAFIAGLRRKLAFVCYRIPRSDEDDYMDDNRGVGILADIIRANDIIEHSFALDFAHDGSSASGLM